MFVNSEVESEANAYHVKVMCDSMDNPDKSFLLIEPDAALDALTRVVLGAAIEVHSVLGPGLDESCYEIAMTKEPEERGIPYERQVILPVRYKHHLIGEKRLDMLVDRRLVLELKAVETLTSLHKAQLRTYLKLTGCLVGLLINFNVPLLKDGGIKRIIYTPPKVHK